ncbi:MAG TPA: universal stress protein [Flavisolibacter sp.]|jgi:nucleotide-binding universal stress UspA family protein|nr:universal stress protein [Flavisolibacter sp.]
MRKRFIILIDFSEYSGSLLKYASEWSKKVDAQLLLVHQAIVLAPALTDNESRLHIAQYTNKKARQKLKLLANSIVPPDTQVSYSVSEQPLQITLSKILAEEFEDLIFIGLKGTGLLKKLFVGSVALEVIDNTKNLIVALPKEIETFSQKKIFVAVTEKYPMNISELNKFFAFLENKSTSITFFYLAKPNEKTHGIEKQLQDLSDLFAERYNTETAIYEGANPFEDIKKVINNRMDEMLIVQKGSRLLSDQLFRKFLINELVYEGQTPLIVLA